MSLFRIALCALAAFSAAADSAAASGLRVMPVRIDVPAAKRFCSLTVTNDGSDPVSIQVRGYGWSMDAAGTERLDEATGPVVNPAIFTIPEGKSQLIRCSLPAGQGPTEGSWRLILDELPRLEAPQPGTIRSVLRVSIPVFRAPAAARPALSWSTAIDSGEQSRIILRNAGSRHVRIAAIDLRDAAVSHTVAHPPAFGYLLAGAAWTLPMEGSVAKASLAVTDEQGKSETVPPARPDGGHP